MTFDLYPISIKNPWFFSADVNRMIAVVARNKFEKFFEQAKERRRQKSENKLRQLFGARKSIDCENSSKDIGKIVDGMWFYMENKVY